MKLRFSTPLIAAFAALLLLASCSKSNKQGKMIPKEAGFVVHFNGKSLFEKLNIAEIKQTDWYKQMMEEVNMDSTAPVFVKRLHENMASSGVDSVSDMVFFGLKGSDDRMKLVFEGGLRDAKAFESYLKNIYPEGSIVKDGDIQSMAIMSHAVLTWNKDKFAMGILTPEMGGMYSGMPGMSHHDDDTSIVTTESAGLVDITSYCKNLYSLKESNSLGSDEKFTELMNTEGDIHAWVSIDNLMGGADMPMGMMSMMKLDAFTKGNVSTYTVNFDKGKVVVKLKSYMSKELSEILKKYSGGSINTDMIKNIPSENVMGLLAIHFNPEAIKKMVELSGMEPFINLMTMKQGMTVDDFIKANKGDLLLVFSDLKMKKDSFDVAVKMKGKKVDPYVFTKPDMKVLFSAAIGNKEAFNKLIAVAKDMGGDKEDKVHYKSNGNYFALSNDSATVEQYLAGGKHEQPFLSKISGNPIGGYADIQKILMAMPPDGKDSLAKQIWDASVKMWDNAVLTGGDYSGGGISQQFEVNLMDKNTNSLRQLFQYTMIMSALTRKKMKQREAEWKMHPISIDSVRFTPPRIVKDEEILHISTKKIKKN